MKFDMVHWPGLEILISEQCDPHCNNFVLNSSEFVQCSRVN